MASFHRGSQPRLLHGQLALHRVPAMLPKRRPVCPVRPVAGVCSDEDGEWCYHHGIRDHEAVGLSPGKWEPRRQLALDESMNPRGCDPPGPGHVHA
ncbi:hypothetical protein thiamine pyrophosphate enzyme [Aspergillus fumigatus]|nr:hypothetical protein thiamine pyrophosphate enzyme [Aspergillus fumigatus]